VGGAPPVRKECGAQPLEKFFDDFLLIFAKNVLVLKNRILGKYRISKNWDLRDRET